MSNQIREMNFRESEFLKTMKTGYEEMGALNVSLSEEGIEANLNDLKEYEKFLLESE